jgi:hypothetical protein
MHLREEILGSEPVGSWDDRLSSVARTLRQSQTIRKQKMTKMRQYDQACEK